MEHAVSNFLKKEPEKGERAWENKRVREYKKIRTTFRWTRRVIFIASLFSLLSLVMICACPPLIIYKLMRMRSELAPLVHNCIVSVRACCKLPSNAKCVHGELQELTDNDVIKIVRVSMKLQMEMFSDMLRNTNIKRAIVFCAISHSTFRKKCELKKWDVRVLLKSLIKCAVHYSNCLIITESQVHSVLFHHHFHHEYDDDKRTMRDTVERMVS